MERPAVVRGLARAGGDVPAEVCGERRVTLYGRHAAELVAVRVDARHQHLDRASDRWRHVGGIACRIELVEVRTPVVIEHRVDEVVGEENRVRSAIKML